MFFKLGGFVYFENRIAKIFSNEVSANPIVAIRNENLGLVGNKQRDIVFVGDSHTNYFEWSEYFADYSVANRGIGSDTTSGVLKRLDKIIELNPKKVFIMVGINDIQKDIPIKEIQQNYVDIINQLKANNPNIEVYIQSVLPVASEMYERNFYRHSEPINESVLSLNEALRSLDNATFIDIAQKFGEELAEENTVDGIHLSRKGYDLWLDSIEEFIQ